MARRGKGAVGGDGWGQGGGPAERRCAWSRDHLGSPHLFLLHAHVRVLTFFCFRTGSLLASQHWEAREVGEARVSETALMVCVCKPTAATTS